MQSVEINFLEVSKEELVSVQMPQALREKFFVLVQAGVFNVDYGRATLNFAEGQIASVSVEQRTYDRKVIPKGKSNLGPP